MPSGSDAYEKVEKGDEPHAMSDFEQVDKQDQKFVEQMQRRIRVTKKDLEKYGFSPNCPRCEAIQRGVVDPQQHHTEDCRFRIYSEWEQHNDPKWKLLSK